MNQHASGIPVRGEEKRLYAALLSRDELACVADALAKADSASAEHAGAAKSVAEALARAQGK